MSSSPEMASTILVAAALLGATANAIQFFPLPTHSVVLPGNGITPRPTPGPEGFAELRKRQNNDVEVVLVGPDNTCGYVSGSIGACSPGGIGEGGSRRSSKLTRSLRRE